jgi:WD40 repeat protein
MIRPGDEPIPGYRVEQMLGRGQYGEVWRATTPGRSTVALKFLDMTGRRGWKEFRAVQRVKQIRYAHLMPIVALWLLDSEGKVLTEDAVENLVAVEDSSEKTLVAGSGTVTDSTQPAQMVIATLLGDMSLQDRLAECLDAGQQGIPIDELLGYMQETAKGIDHLNTVQHDWDGGQVGVQHCDIKPDNVMLMGGSIVICDFGVAQIFADTEDTARATSLSGSPAYMAPEAFEARPSKTSDQYSLAVMYYELRTGELPLDARNFAAAYDIHRTGRLDFSRVPPREQDVLRRATQADPNRRFSSSGEFVRELLRAHQPPPAPAGSAGRWLAVVAGLVVVGLAAAGGYAWWKAHPRDVTLQLRFDAPGARLLINGQEMVVGSEGLVTVETPPQEPVTISAAGNPDRKDAQWTIAASELADKREFEFALAFTHDYHAARADRLLAAGNTPQAAEAYALAVQEAPEKYARLPAPTLQETSGMLWEDCLQVSPDGNWLVAGGMDGRVVRWKIGPEGIQSESQLVHRHEGGRVVNVVASDTLVASACDLGIVWATSESGGEQLLDAEGAEVDVALTGSGARLIAAVASDLSTELVCWDLGAATIGDSLRTVGKQPGEFPRLIRSEGDSVVLVTKDDTALVWKWQIEPPGHVEVGRQQNDVLSVSASTDGTVIAYAGVANSEGETDEAAMVNVKANVRYRLDSRQADSILACALEADGDRLATAERLGEFDETGTVWLWRPDLATGTAVSDRVLQYDRQLGDVSALVISRGTGWIAAGHEGGAITLWRGTSDNPRPWLTYGRGDRVVALRITPDRRWLVAGARDGRLVVFDLRRLEMLHRALEKAEVAPQVEPDQVTLRDRFQPPGLRFLWEGVESESPPPRRPTAAPA